jgi:uncharacterized repeat protein (TIGR01451 family)
MGNSTGQLTLVKRVYLGLAILGGLLLLAAVSLVLRPGLPVARADPINPPEGYPKLKLSTKTVTPTLAHTGGVTLYYTIEIRNTGAYTAANTTLTDIIPDGTTYNDDLASNVPFTPTVDGGTLTWVGDVGFDSTAVVSFSVAVSPSFTGTVRNTAAISHPLITQPITVTAETVVTDEPILTIEKSSAPTKPGANKPLLYTIVVANQGQPTPPSTFITVTDRVPLNTTLSDIGADGVSGTIGSDVMITWTRQVMLDLGDTTAFTFSVMVGDVPSGTVLANEHYQVVGPESGVTAGELYTVTVVDPIFWLSKDVWPNPPGSNREMTYTLTLLNVGSLATDLVITDRVPAGVEYMRGGSEAGGIVSWTLPSLDTGGSAEFAFTIYISDVMGIPVVNDDYVACCSEGICLRGNVLTNVVHGPTFEASVTLNPIAKKPGGGGGPVTPTLIVRNLGPGNAIDAMALLEFRNISVKANQLYAIPPIGTAPPFPSVNCGPQCDSFIWVGSLGAGEAIMFTTSEGQSTQIGEEGNLYTATIVITDDLSNMSTVPVTGTATGKITHYANLIPTKSAPPVIGRGQLLTYTINIWNSALSTEGSPVLTDRVPISTTFVWASDGGMTQTISDTVIVSWTLPALSTSESTYRIFTVLVDDDLVSGTQIVNSVYDVSGYGNIVSGAVTSGLPVTTTVREVGLIDSYKEVTPTVALPGSSTVLTYYLHIVNSSALSLTGVTVEDFLPWQYSTYQRDAVASGGEIISDIVSIHWTGGVGAFSSEVVTFTVLVDPDHQGPITNTAVISHPSLLNAVTVHAVAYVTEGPVLYITKSASPDPVEKDAELLYAIHVINLGQQATSLVITDTVPADTEYVPGSATASGQLVGEQVRWEIPVLMAGDSRTVEFRVTVRGRRQVVNELYGVTCAEGVTAAGAPVTTRIAGGGGPVYLPLVLRNAS